MCRTVIGRTLGGKATFKALHECLKLHLPASFISAMLLMRGYFNILVKNEEGAIATRKLTAIEWSGLNLSFSRYTPNFNANSQGAKALLMHIIKIQFPDLHEQFRNIRALTIMASNVATLTWPSVGVKPNTWKSWGFGVLRDSRMFRARQQDPKHLALGCSWCHWKGLEA